MSTPEKIVEVSTQMELTAETKERLKAMYGKELKKVKLMGQEFVFRPITHSQWEDDIKSWMKSYVDARKEFTPEDLMQKLIETALVFPSLNFDFENPAHEKVFWNNQPAGVMPRLSKQIEHYSGFVVPELLREDEFYAENIEGELEIPPRPSEEVLEELRRKTMLPMRLIRVGAEWYVIRAMKHSEGKAVSKSISEDREGEHDIKQLRRCILLGDTDFDDKPAGLVKFLMDSVIDISGLGDEDGIFGEVVEDL